MSGNCFLLVANEAYLTDARRAYVSNILDCSPLFYSFEAVHEHLETETAGVLLIVAASCADGEPILRLIQDIRLRKLPPVLVLLVADRILESSLAFLDPYLFKRLRWPDEAAALSQLTQRCRQGSKFTGIRPETPKDILACRLSAQTPSLAPLAENLALAAAHDITVLLSGETGTGKSFLARLLHDCSSRREHRFLTVPCGALAANLVESEFFGHAQGAFTGADRPKVGKFTAVGKGTLFLDEVDTLNLEHQVALLRVIETGEFEPVGSNKTQYSEARVIVASNMNLEEEAQQRRFRQDLYYRLNVMSFHLPPLRNRPQDIAPLVRSMVARFSRKFHKELFDIQPETLAALESFAWPGNIRQLENVIQHAVLVSAGRELSLQHLPLLTSGTGTSSNAGAGVVDSLRHRLELLECDLIQRALMTNAYNLSRAADTLGISRVTIHHKMKKYGLRAGRRTHPNSIQSEQPRVAHRPEAE